MAGFNKTLKDSFKESTKEVKKLLTAPTTVERVKISDIKRAGAAVSESNVMLHPTGDGLSDKGWTTCILARPDGTGLTLWVNPEKHELDLDGPVEVAELKYRMAKDSKDTGFLISCE